MASKLAYGHSPKATSESVELSFLDFDSDVISSKSCKSSLLKSSSTNQMDPRFYIEQSSDLPNVFSPYVEPTRSKVNKLAHLAMDELSNIAVAKKPLWQPQKGQKFETMDHIEYLRNYSQLEETIWEIAKIAEVREPQHLPSFNQMPLGYVPMPNATQREHVKNESSRDMEYIQINPIDFVHLLMDVDQWSSVFCNIVSRAAFLGILSNGVEGGYNGRLQVMSAEFQLPTPFIETRQCYFARYSKKLSRDTWGVVDVSLEKFFPSPTTKFRRRPSGCLIQQMPNGFSKIIWVEHVAEDYSRLNSQFQLFVSSTLAFGATRWLASLARWIECNETLTAIAASPTDHLDVDLAPVAKTSLLHVAGRMVRSFTADISASSDIQWTQFGSLFGSIDMRVRVKSSVQEFGRTQDSTVIFTTSVWLPASPKQLFNFLSDHEFRFKWDMLSSQFHIKQLTSISQGNDQGNRVSLVQVQTGQDQYGTFFLQDSYTDKTGASYIVYSPVEKSALANLLNGGNPDHVAIMPSGFTILPDGMSSSGDDADGVGGGSGSILTIAYYIILSLPGRPLFIPHATVSIFRQIINDTLTVIKNAIL